MAIPPQLMMMIGNALLKGNEEAEGRQSGTMESIMAMLRGNTQPQLSQFGQAPNERIPGRVTTFQPGRIGGFQGGLADLMGGNNGF